ncbi:MAG: hypothetical protein HFI37_05005 [Lachnospiraceae bacterium]|jgi:RNA-binding protein YlmH|nr:hypothetical protein [Lachnospiraceae bacterium]
MGNEQDLLQKRYMDLSRQANRKGIVIYSDFLNLSEQNLLNSVKNKLETSYETYGGYDFAERKIAAFLPDDLAYEWEYPLICLKITPAYPKYAEHLSHRDILGAVMHQGLERSKIGDILCKEEDFYLFCEEHIKSYLLDCIQKVRNTSVNIEQVALLEAPVLPKFIEKSGIITSNRLDSLVACFCNCSRNEASKLISGGKVFIDGKEMLSNTYTCKEGDIISVRSFGKYIFDACSGETKKGRLKIKYRVYS